MKAVQSVAVKVFQTSSKAASPPPHCYRTISRQPIPFRPGMFSVATDVSRLKLLRLK